MHKNYYLIIIILFVCIINLYVIADYSDVVGSASVSFENYTFSLPPNYEVTSTYDFFVQVHNSKLGYAAVEHKSDNFDYNYSAILSNLQSYSNTTILSKGIITVGNISVDSIYYRTVDDNNFVNNRSIFYFEKYGELFQIEMNGFKYDDVNETINTLEYIVETIKPNYKI